MSTSNPQHEPTMEEILASIRKIISEDQPESAPPKPAEPVRAQAPQPAPEPEVLDLTEEVHDDGTVEPVETAPERPLEQDVIFQAIDEPPEAQQQTGADMDTDDLISDSTRHAVGRVFESFDEPEPPRAPRPDGDSVEAVFARAVQDSFEPTLREWVDSNTDEIVAALKPLIREWMDDNLPALIEAAVQKEISRNFRRR